MVGICLHPDKAYVEFRVQLYNRTPLVQTFLWWVNVGVHVHDDYQVVFPPDVTTVTDHSKRAMAHFPIAHGRYYGLDLEGVDLRWYKHIPVPCSYFCYHSDQDYFGGYDHRHRAGLIHVANHHISPGKKMFTWGKAAFGDAWERNLTDEDGPYIELMAGVYTDNQPDFSWLQPYETKTFSQFWYPIQEIGPPVAANRRLALNLEVEGRQATLGVCATEVLPWAKVRLTAAGQALFECELDLMPGAPFRQRVDLPSDAAGSGIDAGDLCLTVQDRSGVTLLAYRPQTPPDKPLPEPMKPPPPPSEIAGIEALYLTGLHLEQYRHPTIDPEPYWERALELEPGDARCNNALGLAHLRRGRYQEAEAHFRQAIETLTRRNPNPRDSEPFYNLGLALKRQRRYLAAYDAFYKAIWSHAWQGAAYYALAEIDCQRGEYERALGHLDRCLEVNARHLKARNLQSAALRHLEWYDEAEWIASDTVLLDPLDFWSRYEQVLVCRVRGDVEEAEAQQAALVELLRVGTGREEVQVYLDLAFDYADAGLWEEASGCLALLTDRELDDPESDRFFDPMLVYARGFFAQQQGRAAEARALYRHASTLSPHLVFHARLQELEILEQVLLRYPQDARAHYYLGNLLYDKLRYEEAKTHWKAACQLDPGFSVPWRNLGVAAHNVDHNPEQARAYYERAIAINPHDGRVLSELDQLARRQGEPPAERLARLEAHPDLIAERDDLTAAQAALYNQLGQPQKALEILGARRFHPWEGGEGGVADQYERAHLALGQAALEAGQNQEALKHFGAASVYPENLGVGRSVLRPDAHLHYYAGLAYRSLGNEAQAKARFEQAAQPQAHLSAATYYQALAMQALGKAETAQERLAQLRDHAQQRLESTGETGFSTSVPAFVFFEDDPGRRARIAFTFVLGLAQLGMGETEAARQAFEAVLELDANHTDARGQLQQLKSS
jgi:tetratricopeptide (TPR) repeat protein